MPRMFRTVATTPFTTELEARIRVLDKLQALLQEEGENHTGRAVVRRWGRNGHYLTAEEAERQVRGERRNLRRASKRLGKFLSQLQDTFTTARAWQAADMADMVESARLGKERFVCTFQTSLMATLKELCSRAQALLEAPLTIRYEELCKC